MVDEIWYRYDAIHYAPPMDEFEHPCGDGKIGIRLREFKVIKQTPKGVWVIWRSGIFSDSYEDKRFILRDARKRYACPTKEEAAESYRARKERQVRMLKAQLRDAERALALNIWIYKAVLKYPNEKESKT